MQKMLPITKISDTMIEDKVMVLLFKSVYYQRMSEGKQLLEYYQNKIDELYKERLAWLSKFDQCNSLLQEKQQLMRHLKDHKDKELDLHRGIVHHDVALLDQKLNVVRMERENINNQFLDAEEILKMEELMEEYPQELEKHLPCKVLANGGPTIDNQLNIHAASKKGKKSSMNIFRENNSVLSSGKASEDPKIKYKPSKEELFKRQIIELKTNQQKEICLLKQQKRKIEELLHAVREKQEESLQSEREVLDKLRSDLRRQEQKHKQLAEKYFNTRKLLKQESQETKCQNERLKTTVASLEQKVNEEMRVYEKENKAKQTLIVRKSQDFQEDYKARMRAKERNLQALKDNYEKMQQVCIDKIKKLEETLTNSKHRLNFTEQKKNIEISQLKNELSILEKQVGQERAEKARIDDIMRNKIEQDKRRRLQLEQKQEEERRKNERAKQISQAYKATLKPSKQPNYGKPKYAQVAKRSARPEKSDSEEDSEEESMALSDLQNIRQQIHKLEDKLQEKGNRKR